ncbi:hypothetical protein LIV57_20875 [Chryseobacterium sp. X308]|uniref:hypothetical protein n=1 Tax=Chryseobacterium sp. X308 TaxID=2884873 RepID=UPI001D143C9E|nr:hypothetical protein [Chryseobacterium sp. X308]MCC3217722.1 hypothetical protein [Chryseobacterium sp. X308]
MKKKFLLLAILFAFIKAYSQTGINTSSPSAALDVVSKGNSSATKALEVNDNTNKELMRVEDDGGVRLEKYKNIGVLGTDSDGFLTDASNLNIPAISTIGLVNTSVNQAANTDYTVAFTINKNNVANMTYNNGSFTINKAGYYNFSVFVKYDTSMNNPSGGSATTSILKNGSSFSVNVSGHMDGTQYLGHNLAGTQFFNVGDVVTVTASYTRVFRITQGSVTIVYYGA